MDASRAQAEATRLLPLAEEVLSRYPFVVRDVTHLATHSNALFRVVTESGEQMVLRVGTPHANERSNIEIEVAWLDALVHETDLDVVRPIHTADGELIVDVFDDAIGESRSCVLFTWIAGQPMAEGSGTFAYRALGTMCASLQAHGREWEPPERGNLRTWDEVFYYQDFDPVVIDNPKFGHLFDARRIAKVTQAAALAQIVIDDSYETASPQIVHGDLHEWNVHIVGGRLYAFDFEDVMLALPAQDAAICLYSSRTSDMTTDIRAAFRKGYETVSPWPVIDERQLDGFHAARQVMLMNYAARTLPVSEAESYLNRVWPWLEAYVDRYG